MIMISVLSDMDGTLLDTQRICIPAWDHAGAKQGIENMGRYIPSVCGMNAQGWGGFIIDRHPEIDLDRFTLDAHEYIERNLKIRYKKGAGELLSLLWEGGIRTAVASGSSHASIEHHLRELGVYERFDAVVGGHDVEHGKPAPDIFLLAAEKIGAEPSDCIVFEDSANGVRAGHAAGMRVIGIPDIVEFPADVKALLWHELSDMTEAAEILKKLI
jgi:beta-phosphoglucomutase-like phosphatase (HAD superfamily)